MAEALLRRSLLGQAASAAVLAGCATRARVVVNLAGPQPEDQAALDTGADMAWRMTVPVQLNDEGPFNFVVDTGANHSVLSHEIAGALNLPPGRPAAVHGIAGVEQAPTALVDTLSVGQLLSRRVRTPLLPRSRLGAEGLLGVDVLKDREVILDFEQKRFLVGASRPYAMAGADVGRLRQSAPLSDVVVVKARYRFGQLIIIDADVGGQPVTAFLDSGSQNTVGNLALGRALNLFSHDRRMERTEVQLISATGQTATGELLPIPPLRLGGLRIGQMSAVFADLHIFALWGLISRPAILIGIDVMRHFRAIEIDYGQRQVSFRLPGESPRPGR